MNFFEAQDKARRNTALLIFLFGLAVLGLVILTNLLVMAVLAYLNTDKGGMLIEPFNWSRFYFVGLLVLLLIGLGSAYKMLALSGGGHTVAEMLGGTLMPRSSTDPLQRRLLNVVEEMAIASGAPVPRVYLLNEAGINAFAAGYSAHNAVIGITQGALESLSREELQGVVAHEFSHIFNGDMRLNIRLIGVLNGILLSYLIGDFVLRITRFGGSSRNAKNAVPALFLLGIGLMAVGGLGKLFGQWIKAVVSRQREYLADASAVQFTRSSSGIANALKKIGGLNAGSLLQAPSAQQYSHAYFAEGISTFWLSQFATHPPLEKRIRQLEPAWDGVYVSPIYQDVSSGPETLPGEKTLFDLSGGGNVAGTVLSGAILARTVDALVAQIGTIQQAGIDYAQVLIAQIPQSVKVATEDPYGARAVVYALLIHNDKHETAEQIRRLQVKSEPSVAAHAIALLDDLETMPSVLHLPLIELVMPSLQQLSLTQYERFRSVVQALIGADMQVDLKEWFMQRLLIQSLDVQFGLRKRPKAIHSLLGTVKEEAELVLSLIAYADHAEVADAKAAFEAGTRSVGAAALRMRARSEFSLDKLNQAVDTLELLKPLVKSRVIKACVAIVLYEAGVSARAMELLRALCAALDCPMPALSVVE